MKVMNIKNKPPTETGGLRWAESPATHFVALILMKKAFHKKGKKTNMSEKNILHFFLSEIFSICFLLIRFRMLRFFGFGYFLEGGRGVGPAPRSLGNVSIFEAKFEVISQS